jgi:flagellar motor switch protein FliM
VVEIICRELTAAWQPVGLSFNFERRQMQTQVARIMSVTEKTLCLSFEIRMPHSSGSAQPGFSGGGGQYHPAPAHFGLGPQPPPCRRDPRPHGNLGAQDPLRRQPAAALVRLAASTIENLEPGTVLRLDLPANTLPIWQVGGQHLAQAQAIRHGLHRGARMERPIAKRSDGEA